MKTVIFLTEFVGTPEKIGSVQFEMNSMVWYSLGGIIAVCLLGYLIYALLKPEKL